MSHLREYVVTLKDYNDLEGFYHDMEQNSSASHIPDRPVSCHRRRPISRNTHYYLTDDEANNLKNDPRVVDVELADRIIASITPLYSQPGNFNKSATDNASHLNWGLLRATRGSGIANWGSDGNAVTTSTVNFSATGKGIDVIIIDGHIDPDHPEYARNQNGTGGSRVVQFDWNTLTPATSGLDDDAAPGLSGTYIYTPYVNPLDSILTADNNHGAHVAGTACGNKYGWARDANIYNINPYASNPNNVNPLLMWDYIRAFHFSKPINDQTKRKNPTVCNGSYGSSLLFPFTYPTFSTGPIVYINNRGVEYGTTASTTALSDSDITNGGIYVSSGIARVPVYSAAIAADIEDAIADGIHVIGAAGNEYSKVDSQDGLDYNNYFLDYVSGSYFTNYQHRGTAPSAAPGVICVGNIDSTVEERKRTTSNCGPRIDVYAPGTNINSSVHSGGVSDPRNGSYFVEKKTGTSMSAPQVTGVVACLLELYPTMTPAEVRAYIISEAKFGQISDPAPNNQSNLFSLQGSSNKYLFARNYRGSTGQLWPRKNRLRPASGLLFPRSRKRF